MKIQCVHNSYIKHGEFGFLINKEFALLIIGKHFFSLTFRKDRDH